MTWRRLKAVVLVACAVTSASCSAATDSALTNSALTNSAATDSGSPISVGHTNGVPAAKSVLTLPPSVIARHNKTRPSSTTTRDGALDTVTPRSVTILGSGDVLLHRPLWTQAQQDFTAKQAKQADQPKQADQADQLTEKHGYDFDEIYASIAPDITAADVAICQLETPVSTPDGPFTPWPRFNVPPQVITTIASLGYDSCTTASNHTLDQGADGVTRTLDALDAAGLAHTGSARTEQEARTPLIITADNGVRIGQLAYTFGFNGIDRPPGKPWIANPINIPAILAAAHTLKEQGADIVVVSMHWGVEYDHLATDTQKRQARTLLASPDIDLILGAHAHVVQPMQRIDGEWVVYGMGNQVARHADPIDASREGIMPVFTFTEDSQGGFQVTDAEIIPTWMQLEPELRLIDLPRALADTDLSAKRRELYRNATDRISGYVDAYGADVPVWTPSASSTAAP